MPRNNQISNKVKNNHNGGKGRKPKNADVTVVTVKAFVREEKGNSIQQQADAFQKRKTGKFAAFRPPAEDIAVATAAMQASLG